MTTKINRKIVGYAVRRADESVAPTGGPDDQNPRVAEVIQMHERLERPDVLVGSTYKVKSPLFDHALYVTINDVVLNGGTPHEQRRPFEIFVNSKNMDHFQWIVALTRIMSAVFRKGGDCTFLVEEMKAVFDPRGGYFKAGGVYMPSIVAEIGAVVEAHMKSIGLIVGDEADPAMLALIAKKRAALAATPQPDAVLASATTAAETSLITAVGSAAAAASDFPPSATLCSKCSTKAVLLLDGCATCLSCGHSKCG